MRICVSLARQRLGDLVERARLGEEIILTKRGEPVVRFTALKSETEKMNRRTPKDTASNKSI